MADHDINILIKAKDLASKVVGGVDKKLQGLGKTASKIGGHIKTGATTAATAIGVTLVGGIASGIRSLDELERVMGQTNAVIASTKGKAGVSAKSVADLANELENLTTADNKAIQQGENMLLTFTGIGNRVFPRATKAATNLAIAMAGGDVENANFAASAIQVGKALNDPIKGVTALRKVGVSFTDQQLKQIKALVKAGKVEQAQAIILRELETEFGKAGEAAGKGPGAAWRRLKDVGEDLSMALAKGVLPSLIRVSEWLNKKLADPAVQKTLENIGDELGKMVDKGLKLVDSIDWKVIGDSLKIAGEGAKALFNAFTSLPPWVQTAVLTGWGLNKLTGGALTGIVGELGKGLVKGVLGLTAGVVNIKAGTVVGGGGAGVPGAAGGGAGIAEKVGAGAAALAGAEIIQAAHDFGSQAGKDMLNGFLPAMPQAGEAFARVFGAHASMSIPGFDALQHLDEIPGQFQQFADFLGGKVDIAGNKITTLTNVTSAGLGSVGNRVTGAANSLNSTTASVGNRVTGATNSMKAGVTSAINSKGAQYVAAAHGTTTAINSKGAQYVAAAHGTTAAIANKRWQFTVNNTIKTSVNISGRDLFSQTQHQGARQTIR